MSRRSLYEILVPDAPLHLHTEVDEPVDERFALRANAVRHVVPGLQAPNLVSSFDGSIDRILLCLPSWAVADPRLVEGYRSLIGALRTGTTFVVVHNAGAWDQLRAWFEEAGHAADNLEPVPLHDFVALTDWAEDAYVALVDADDSVRYLVEPWSFVRAGDALIADAVEEYTDVRATGSPLIFQGGNCLIGDDFWFLGRDYFADTVALLSAGRPPITTPAGTPVDEFVRDLFARYLDTARRLVLIGTQRPIPFRDYVGSREGDAFFLDVPTGGSGTFQPIFHIDMFVTLMGRSDDGVFEVLVGDPAMADERLGTTSPFALAPVYDGIARDLEGAGFRVHRNPLVHRPSLGQTLTLARLRELADGPDNAVLVPAIRELSAAGATGQTPVRVRVWHHITWNNCLVENSHRVGKHLYLPTFGHGDHADLAPLDDEMAAMWEGFGFEVHRLGDFNPFASRQGVVHCIKKYLARGD